MNLMEWRILLDKLINDSDFAHKSYFAGGCVRDFLLIPIVLSQAILISVWKFLKEELPGQILQNYLRKVILLSIKFWNCFLAL